MFDFFKKKQKHQEFIEPKKDPFPTYDEVKNLTIIDIRDSEDIEYYGKYPNSVHIPFDEYFASKLMMLDKNKKYGIMDLKGIDSILDEAVKIAKEVGLDVKKLKGGFFYISEVLNYKPIKE
ncbi:rhodanese-like domain-containing protein [Caminibacter mediatlanticus TB-2]|uniref:Rhodanese-like domain-containing protein n=1 Tax=Caminibacter mediatlanticus TB-2 TaxID=391592 RepID=A0ABX5VB29_9BACT|nr:rhodanese-like domain-containing protein [Caminibacter mediatlanticus]QCT94011.1 rhodanese-like domain-containing protein [Caminibacter mediatlanticus TB-2]